VESAGRETVLFFFRCFKTYTNSWRGKPRRFPPNNEWVGSSRGSSQPGEVVWAILGNLHEPQTFPTSSLPYYECEWFKECHVCSSSPQSSIAPCYLNHSKQVPHNKCQVPGSTPVCDPQPSICCILQVMKLRFKEIQQDI
jgi:hypothetical protein